MLRNREVKTHRGVDTRARGRPRERRPRTRVPAAVRAGTRVCGRQEGGVARPRWKRTRLLRKLDASSAFETGVPRLMFSQEKFKKKKTCVYTTIYTGIIITALFSIAQNANRPTYPSTHCGISNDELLWCQEQHRWISKTLCLSEEARHKGAHVGRIRAICKFLEERS